jgi:predicted lipase
LVFRGTEQYPRDFVMDIALPLVPFGTGPGTVHSGFLEALKSVWGPISEAMSRLDVPLFYTGHSLGAALATLAAACRPPIALYTFGSPLVGDSAFARTLSKVPVFRIVNGTDAVTVVPPGDLGFCHVGEVHRLSGHSQPGILRHPLDWLRSLFGPSPSLADHAPINYVERLAP